MSNLTLRNDTAYIAQYVVLNGEQVIARIPGIGPGSLMRIPTNDTYQVTATAVIDGNTYISAPLDVSGATGFLAQVAQVQSQGTYEFNLVELPGNNPNQLQFQKTCLSAVTFTISKNGAPLQTVAVSNAFEIQTLAIGDTFYVYAIVNGVTTDTVTTTNPDAVVTTRADPSTLEFGYFILDID